MQIHALIHNFCCYFFFHSHNRLHPYSNACLFDPDPSHHLLPDHNAPADHNLLCDHHNLRLHLHSDHSRNLVHHLHLRTHHNPDHHLHTRHNPVHTFRGPHANVHLRVGQSLCALEDP